MARDEFFISWRPFMRTSVYGAVTLNFGTIQADAGGASAADDGTNIVVQVGSGNYRFELTGR